MTPSTRRRRWGALALAAIAVFATTPPAAWANAGPSSRPAAAKPRAGEVARPGAPSAPSPDRIAIVDLRKAGADPAVRARIGAALRARGQAPVDDDDAALAAALAGEPDPTPAQERARLLAEAQRAYGELRCGDALPAAERAARAYLAADEPAAVAAPLERALAIVLLCADSAGDRARAQGAAERLRALRAKDAGPPAGVPAATWAAYPVVDAKANVPRAPVRIETDPPGARVWVDLVPVGEAPVEPSLAAGRRWIVAAAPGRQRAITEVVVDGGRPATVQLALPPVASDPRGSLRARVAAWRAAGEPPERRELAEALREAGVSRAVVLGADGKATVVTLATGAAEVREARSVTPAEPDAVGDAVVAVAPARRGSKDGASGRELTWVYVVVGVAASLAIGAIVAGEMASTTQRVEVRWP